MIDVPERLRVFFFSDWRLQPLELAEAMLEAADPVDIILYGGDDIRRFKPLPDVPEAVVSGVARKGVHWTIPTMFGTVGSGTQARNLRCLPGATLRRLTTNHPEKAIAVVADVLGRPPICDPVPNPAGVISLGEILELFQPPEQNNWLHEMASKARFGLGAVLGNDCAPGDRQVLRCVGVQDLHAAPTVFGGWGFVGLEGSIYRERDEGNDRVNGIGFILHPEQEVSSHLYRAIERLEAPAQRLVIVSHTPPAGCRLDVGIRFGLDYLGSPALADFVRTMEPAVVLCGHCHCRGGKSAHSGRTLVVNGASNDVNVRQARAAIIELEADQPPTLTWIDPIPHSVVFMPDIGAKRAERLAAAGIVRPAQLFDAGDEILKSISFGEIRQHRLQAYRLAVAENRSVWLPGPPISLPNELLFYDVETGLNLGSPLGPLLRQPSESPQEPWMIGALAPGLDRVEQWVAADEDQALRRQMFRNFLNLAQHHPSAPLCSWSGNKFDERAVTAGLRRWHRRALAEWESLPQIDLLSVLKRRLVLPTTDWSLKSVAGWCGFVWTTIEEPGLDGFEVGLRYEEFRKWGMPLPVEMIARYNADDVLALAHVVNWVREQVWLQQDSVEPAQLQRSTP